MSRAINEVGLNVKMFGGRIGLIASWLIEKPDVSDAERARQPLFVAPGWRLCDRRGQVLPGSKNT
jgi:hypothetical protein